MKASSEPVGPGPNVFSDSQKNVWVDARGRLHLRIAYAGGRWRCAEVVNPQSLGYWTYTFVLDSRVDSLDPNATLGLFTYGSDPAYANRELDIEFARWSNPADPTNAQFVVQPYDAAGHLVRIRQAGASTSTDAFAWRPGSVAFTASAAAPASWTYSGADVPVPGDEHARLNLWLFRGAAPANGKPVEVVVRSFAFSATG